MEVRRSRCAGLITDLAPDKLITVENDCRSGYISSVGFLDDKDNLVDIFSQDNMLLEKEGITRQQIVDRLRTIVCQYKRKKELISPWTLQYNPIIADKHRKEIQALPKHISEHQFINCYGRGIPYLNGSSIVIENRYIVSCHSYWGFQSCPFRGGICDDFIHYREELGGGDDYYIYDQIKKSVLKFNDLLLHLIEDHGFFQGNVYHRLPPKKVIDFFDLTSNTNYQPEYVTEERYIFVNEGGDVSACHNFGSENIVNITTEENTVFIKVEQRVKEEAYYLCTVNNLNIKHSFERKKKSRYERRNVQYTPIPEEL